MNNIDSNTGEIVMYQPDETIRLEVRVENETVWLTQQQIADLFQSSRTNVVEHVMHIYEDEELEESSTCRKFRQVRKEGKRTVSRLVPMYNLDMIISDHPDDAQQARCQRFSHHLHPSVIKSATA